LTIKIFSCRNSLDKNTNNKNNKEKDKTLKTEIFKPFGINSVGAILRETMRKVVMDIHSQRDIFSVFQKKVDYKPDREDVVTSADLNAQKVILYSLTFHFPGVGIIAEEEDLIVPCTIPNTDAYFTVDPLDGTKAFIRRSSHGVGSMISLVVDGKIEAVFIGDVMSLEIYCYYPGPDGVLRLYAGLNHKKLLEVDKSKGLSSRYLLLREHPEHFHESIGALTRLPKNGGLFKSIEIQKGSIGSCMARLWKGEVGAVLLESGKNTPWDHNPIIGMSQKLGFVFLQFDREKCRWFDRKVGPIKEIEEWNTETLVLHESRLAEFGQFTMKAYPWPDETGGS
jgi:fructose-1,6-bisphosphatase/inositol monophosphatase family enzyme